MLDHLLNPIRDDAPCGDDLSFSPEFDEIAELRREDDPHLDQGAWVTALKVADWPGVSERTQHLLSQRTKDLRLVAWLTEALTHTHGFQGLAHGLDLLGRLSDRYWDELYPRPDGADIEERTGNLNWMLSRIGLLVRSVPVTRGRQARLSLADLEQARNQKQAEVDSGSYDQAHRATMDQWLTSLRESPTAHLRSTVEGIDACCSALEQLEFIAGARWRDEAPSFSTAREALASARAEIRRWAQEVGAIVPPDPAQHGASAGAHAGAAGYAPAEFAGTGQEFTPPPHAAGAASPAPTTHGGPIRSRSQALQQLREVADYFRVAEPHSPVAYLADKAVRWGSMPLHEWLRLVVKDSGSLSHVDEMLGIMRNPE